MLMRLLLTVLLGAPVFVDLSSSFGGCAWFSSAGYVEGIYPTIS